MVVNKMPVYERVLDEMALDKVVVAERASW
jgi:hypothetical protein